MKFTGTAIEKKIPSGCITSIVDYLLNGLLESTSRYGYLFLFLYICFRTALGACIILSYFKRRAEKSQRAEKSHDMYKV